jgi:hypothetical protein
MNPELAVLIRATRADVCRPQAHLFDIERQNHIAEQTVRKENYFHDFDGPGWPTPAEMKTYFSAERWVSEGGNDSGNDNWTLKVEGLYGTDALPHRDAVT